MRPLLIILVFAVLPLYADELKINAKSSALVVIAEQASPTAIFAAKELASALNENPGIKCKQITDGEYTPGVKGLVLFVGPSKWTKHIPAEKLPYDHFILKRDKNKIYLLGHDDNVNPLTNYFAARTGTLYAVYRFMRQFLGIRRLWPGESGEIVVKKNNISLPEFNITEGPKLPIRKSYYGYGRYYGSESNAALVRWGRFNGMGSSVQGFIGHASEIAVGDKYFKEHPEYYALRKGKRQLLGHRGKLCHSNPAVAEIFAEWGVNNNRVGSFRMDDHFSVSANDSSGWCECDECRKLDGIQKDEANICVSGRMFTLANRVARLVKKKGSNKKVAIYAYASYLEPPANIKSMENNVMIMIARGISWNCAPMEAEKFIRLFDAWAEKTSRIALRDYRNNSCPMIIYPYPVLADKYIKYLSRKFKHFQGINICGDDTRAGALWGPTAYVYAALMWDPEKKLKDILDDYYMNGWPGGHKFIRQYFELFEKRVYAVMKEKNQLLWPQKAENALLLARAIYSPEIMDSARKLLDQAYDSAKSSDERKRVDVIRVGWQAAVNDSAYFESLMKVASFSGSLNGIPALPELQGKEILPMDKVRYLKEAIEKIKIRYAFLEKYKNSEGIPSIMLMNQNLRFFKGWNETVKQMYKLYSTDNSSVIVIYKPWKFSLDPDNKGFKNKWMRTDFDDSEWADISTDGAWEKQGYGQDKYPKTRGYNGWGWYRKTLTFPAHKGIERIVLTLGAVDESYDLYINGELAKKFRFNSRINPNSWQEPQNIDISQYIKWNDKNQITVAVLDESGNGGIWKPCYYTLIKKNLLEDGQAWKYPSSNLNLKLQGDLCQAELKGKDGSLTVKSSCESGRKYKLGIKVKPEGNIFYKVPFGVKIYFKDDKGKNLSSPVISGGISKRNIKIGKWNNFETNFTAPPRSAYMIIKFSLRCQKAGLKDASLTER